MFHFRRLKNFDSKYIFSIQAFLLAISHLIISSTWKLLQTVSEKSARKQTVLEKWHGKFKNLVGKMIPWPSFQQLGGDVAVNSNMTAVNKNQPTFQADHAVSLVEMKNNFIKFHHVFDHIGFLLFLTKRGKLCWCQQNCNNVPDGACYVV